MKQILIITVIELAVSFLFALLVSTNGIDYDFMTGFGLTNLILAVLSAIVGIIIFVAGNKVTGKNLLAASGIILLIGIGVCSAFPIKMKMM